jgi:hypothetical protein
MTVTKGEQNDLRVEKSEHVLLLLPGGLPFWPMSKRISDRVPMRQRFRPQEVGYLTVDTMRLTSVSQAEPLPREGESMLRDF